MLSETFRLEQRIEDLEEQVRYWKDMVVEQESGITLYAVREQFDMTPSEAGVLLRLWRGRGRVVATNILMRSHESTKGGDEDRQDQLIKVFVCKIRRKIGKEHIILHWGVGYSLSEEMVARIDIIMEGIKCVSSLPEAARQTAKAA